MCVDFMLNDRAMLGQAPAHDGCPSRRLGVARGETAHISSRQLIGRLVRGRSRWTDAQNASLPRRSDARSNSATIGEMVIAAVPIAAPNAAASQATSAVVLCAAKESTRLRRASYFVSLTHTSSLNSVFNLSQSCS